MATAEDKVRLHFAPHKVAKFFQSNLLLFLLLFFSVNLCFYWSTIPQNIDALAPTVVRDHPLTDLYARWFGAREVLLHHRDPYNDDFTHELQTAYYGKELDASQATLLTHQQMFAYPLYVIFLFAPTVTMQFHTVQMIFWSLLVAVTAASVPLWAHAVHAKLSPLKLIAALILLFASIPTLQGLALLQLGLLVASLLAAAAASLISGRLFLAGALLALSTIKPQMSLLPIAWFAFWTIGDWFPRRALLIGFATTLGALILASEWVMPTWLVRFPSALLGYHQHTGVTSLLGAVLPSPFSWLAAILLILAGIPFWGQAIRRPASSNSFALAMAFSLTLSTLVVPAVFHPFNHVLLLPVFLLVVRYWPYLYTAGPLTRLGTYACCALAFMPWLLALAVNFEMLLPSVAWPQEMWLAPLKASLALPFAAVGLLLLLRSKAGADSTSAPVAELSSARSF